MHLLLSNVQKLRLRMLLSRVEKPTSVKENRPPRGQTLGDGAAVQRTTQSVKKRRTDDDNRSHSIIDDLSSGERADDED